MTRRSKAASKLLDAIFYCEYCHLPDEIIPHGLWIDHIIPRAKGGTNDPSNLCVCCASCNQAKRTSVNGYDPLTKATIPLFNPRRDSWNNHFRWSEDHTVIEGLTPIGRATVVELRMNRSQIIKLRRLLIRFGIVF